MAIYAKYAFSVFLKSIENALKSIPCMNGSLNTSIHAQNITSNRSYCVHGRFCFDFGGGVNPWSAGNHGSKDKVHIFRQATNLIVKYKEVATASAVCNTSLQTLCIQ